MAMPITWLHLSDLHASPRTGWDARRITESLCADLAAMQRKYGLRPDLIFFTGDAAFGQLGTKPGESIAEQFLVANSFLKAVRGAFTPEILQRDMYLVPGNHDVNRQEIDPSQEYWLRDKGRTQDQVIEMMQSAGKQWRRYMERLTDYRLFLSQNGYSHLLTDADRLMFADAREVHGWRIGIAGLNSAWSSIGAGDAEKGQLWMAGRYQVGELRTQLGTVDFSIALIHHPGNWLVPQEDPDVQRLLEREFEFVLHGHEHAKWVKSDAATGHTILSAGACYNRSDRVNGYSFVTLDVENAVGNVWLRRYDDAGGGWIPHHIHQRTDDKGRWPLVHLQKWLTTRSSANTATIGSPPDSGMKVARRQRRGASGREDSEQLRDREYERRFREAMEKKFDYLELFGADLPPEAKRHALSVGYVSLSLGKKLNAGSVVGDLESDSLPEPLLAEDVLDQLQPEAARLLIRGVAGSGKSTLMRWITVEAAKHKAPDDIEELFARSLSRLMARHAAKGIDYGIDCGSVTNQVRTPREFLAEFASKYKVTFKTDARGASYFLGDWRTKVPFLIRLRDCPQGRFPRPQEFPVYLAKPLPDAPANWVDRLLRARRGLLILDGVDEVPNKDRDTVRQEIEDLVSAYPGNYFLVTTRPGAVESGWLSHLHFHEATVEPMERADQEKFIDKWHEAVGRELRMVGKASEDLATVAANLKMELRDTPAIARLAVYPLLCAMVCALHRERNKKLPETQAALCEDLCKMLLHRRERETPGFRLDEFPESYRGLLYEHKKHLLAELSYHMVMTGVSSVSEEEADECFAEALQRFPDHARSDSVETAGM